MGFLAESFGVLSLLIRIPEQKRAGMYVAQLVDYLPILQVALGLIPSSTQTGCGTAFLQSQHSEGRDKGISSASSLATS